MQRRLIGHGELSHIAGMVGKFGIKLIFPTAQRLTLFGGYMFLNMFFPEAGRHLNEVGNCNRHDAAYHHPPEESEVA